VPAAPPKPAAEDVTGRGVVMLIEDEAPVRAFASRALKLRGYEVLEAASAEEALDLLADPLLHVDVLVSDVVMPGMDGPSCVREARKMRPDVKVVLVSGYAEDSLKRSMEGLEDCHFLPKPFSLNDLTAKVKDLT
jgi:two-component system cell cycle sensor histidine kinase/response regulator CckA